MNKKRDWLINLRLERKLSQKDAAKLAKLKRACYAHYESGLRTPPVKKAKRIADVFGFEWTKFF